MTFKWGFISEIAVIYVIYTTQNVTVMTSDNLIFVFFPQQFGPNFKDVHQIYDNLAFKNVSNNPYAPDREAFE